MSTYLVSIGNSDDKLSQSRWARFQQSVQELLLDYATQIHGEGFSNPLSEYQNAHFVFETDEEGLEYIKEELARMVGFYDQKSIAFSTLSTELLAAKQ